MEPDKLGAPHTASDTKASASDSAAEQVVTRKSKTPKGVLAAASGVVISVLGVIIANFVSARLPAPVLARPTSTFVTHTANATYPGGRGSGWSEASTILGNDYLTVTASMQPGEGCKASTGWVFQQPLQRLAPLAPGDDLNRWAIRNGGIPQSGNYITLTVQGRNGHTVVILKLGIKIISRAAPPTGTAPYLGGGCGGLVPSFFDVDLDKPGLQAMPVSGLDAAGNKVPAVPLPHVVTESSPEQWRIRILTNGCDCTFVPYFVWSSDGNQGAFDVTNGTGAWRVAAVTRARRAILGPNWRWQAF